MYRLSSRTVLQLLDGDITKVAVDAIVNAANEAMLGGGGVDGAIHRAAGPELLKACQDVEPVRPGIRCPTGEARITPAFRLPAKHVIHTVGPVYHHAEQPDKLLASAYSQSLRLANEYELESIAFPAISCGAYGYPLEEAARIALQTCRTESGHLQRICFVLFDASASAVFQRVASEGLPPETEGE